MANEERIAKAKEWILSVSEESAESLDSRLSHIESKFMNELEDIRDEQDHFKPSDSEWSVREVCLHVSRWMRANSLAVQQLASGVEVEEEEISSLDPDPGDWNQVIVGIKNAFATAHESSKSLDETANLETTCLHPLFGPLNSAKWYAFNLMHINVHTRQIQRVKSDPNFPNA
jgi:hypothetical protein